MSGGIPDVAREEPTNRLYLIYLKLQLVIKEKKEEKLKI